LSGCFCGFSLSMFFYSLGLDFLSGFIKRKKVKNIQA